ncbi:MAG: ABC-2 family transporter protein [Planctomycetes bacterium]|nr:ABC-2 family transporter protein [Planctomycetota bacterium]
MKALVRALPALLSQSLATMFQYRGEIILWAVWGVVYPAVSMAMWAVAVKGAPGGEQIGGYAPRDFAAYFWLTMVVGHVCTAWDVYELGWQIQTGRMSPRLLRPMLPVWQHVADNVAYKLVSLAVLVPIWLLIVVVSRPNFDTGLHELLLAIPAVTLAAIINFVWCYNLAMAAFWVTRMEAIGQAWFGAGLFFGGRLAPLSIMPEPLQTIASALPFKYVIWYPCELLMGRLSPRAMTGEMLNQVVWVVVGLVVFHVVWRAGVKRYSAVGA